MFTDRINRIQPSATLEMTSKAAELKHLGKPVYNMSVGEPDFDTPKNIQKAGIHAIQNGITKNSSNRLGFLMGFQSNPKWGIEFGYFHDPNSLPLTQIFNPKYDPKAADTPARFNDKLMRDSETGFPSEYSRITGLSLSIFIDLDAPKKNSNQKK